MNEGASGSDSTLERLIRILESFDTGRSSLSVSALSRRARLPTPTTYRWVDRLVDTGLLQRNEDGTVSPGMRLWELGARSAPSTTLRDVAMPFMDDVQGVLRQHTQLAILDSDGVLILHRLSARGAVANRAIVAGRLPTFTTSLGLVLLAFSMTHTTESFIEAHRAELGRSLRWGMPSAGSARDVLNPTEGELRRQLAQARRTGFASTDGMIDTEATGVAVPVTIPRSASVAALGVVVPRGSDTTPGLAPMLLAAARGISRAIPSDPTLLTE